MTLAWQCQHCERCAPAVWPRRPDRQRYCNECTAAHIALSKYFDRPSTKHDLEHRARVITAMCRRWRQPVAA